MQVSLTLAIASAIGAAVVNVKLTKVLGDVSTDPIGALTSASWSHTHTHTHTHTLYRHT